MKFVQFNILLFTCCLVFAGTNTLDEITETVRTKTNLNQIRDAWLVNLVPRNASGVVENHAGSLGTDTYQWGGIYVDYAGGANGGLRQYASYMEHEHTSSDSQGFTSTSYVSFEDSPSATEISELNATAFLVIMSCQNGASANYVQSNTGDAIPYIQLFRRTGGVETLLTTWVFSMRPATSGHGYWPSNEMSYIDVTPPTTDFKYVVKAARATDDFVLNACIKVISI